MDTRKYIFKTASLLLLLVVLSAFDGCASWNASNTESLLSAAGFQTRTPSTPDQKQMFAKLTPYQVERRQRNGKVLYTYADPQLNVVYIGGEAEYQKYKELGIKQEIAEERLEAAQINEDASLYNWGPYWGPWNIWW